MELPQVPPDPAPLCTHLQSKSLMVHGEQPDRDPDTLNDCTCVRTGRPLGPDSARVGLRPCSDPDRDCYEEY